MNVLSEDECQEILQECKTPAHIRRHIDQVTKVALLLSDLLHASGVEVNNDLVYAAAQLHDALKVVDIRNFDPENWEDYSEENERRWNELRDEYKDHTHMDAIFELLNNRGYFETAIVASNCGFFEILPEHGGLDSWEEKIVYLADKMVMHDKIVSLQKRLDDLDKRYGDGTPNPDVVKTHDAIKKLGKDIFLKIGLSEEEFLERLK